jgi:hypothetical protein
MERMPFHVRLRRGLRTTDAFNLTEQEMRDRFAGFWRRGQPTTARGRTWPSHEARIQIIEGPALTADQRAKRRGWLNASELGEDVTERIVRADLAAGGAIVAGGPRPRDHTHDLRVGLTAAIAGVLTIAVAGLIVARMPGSGARIAHGSGPAAGAPSDIASAADLRRYVLSRPLWRTTPTTFPGSLQIAFRQQFVSGSPTLAAVDGGAASAYSVAELIGDGASLAGEPIYVVGRVASRTSSPVGTDGWNREGALDVVLAGPSGPDRVRGLISYGYAAPPVGAVVFFRAVVAAVGTTAGGRSTTYVIGLEDPEPTTAFGPTHTDTVTGLARQFGRSALP